MEQTENTPGIKMDKELNDKFMGIIEEERKGIKREKFDLDYAISILKKLRDRGEIKQGDSVEEILKVLNEQYDRIKEI